MNLKTGLLGFSACVLIVGVLHQPLLAQQVQEQPVDGFQSPDVKSLQKQIDDLKTKVDQLSNGDVSGDNYQSLTRLPSQASVLTWEPGPVLTSGDRRFSFEVNSRITYDYSAVNFKDANGISRPVDKINGINLRHLEVGFRGKMFRDFNYRLGVKLVDNKVDVKLAYVDYNFGNTQIVAGQTRTYNTLDKLTPPPNTAFAERAAFINSLKISPRIGLGINHHGNNWSVSGGYFFENIASTNGSNDDSNMASARITYSPHFDNGIGLHFGGSAFYRNENGNAFDHKYSTRPFVKQGDLKPLSSQIFNITGETFYNGEFVATYKSLGFQSEYGVVKNKLSNGELLTANDPSYEGGYVEVSFFPTGGERVIDGKDGRYDKVKIDSPVGAGGMGEVRLAARYDVADFTHEIHGRKQKSLIFAVDWYLNDVMKIQTNYAHTIVRNSLNIKTDIIDTFNMRFLFGF